MHGKKRNLEKSISYLLKNFPSVVLLGARQVGKSTLTSHLFPKHRRFDLEREVDFQRVANDPGLFFEDTKPPFILDEAQKLPQLFEAIKVDIDKNRKNKGRFLITGSSSSELLQSITESLAGRCALVEVNGFSFNEPFEKSMGIKAFWPKVFWALRVSVSPLRGLRSDSSHPRSRKGRRAKAEKLS